MWSVLWQRAGHGADWALSSQMVPWSHCTACFNPTSIGETRRLADEDVYARLVVFICGGNLQQSCDSPHKAATALSLDGAASAKSGITTYAEYYATSDFRA